MNGPSPGPVTPPSRPVLRYYGGKWRLAPRIVELFPPHYIYTEVFGGACSVLMLKSRSRCEIYNDLDGEVVNVFRVLQSRGPGPAAARSPARDAVFPRGIPEVLPPGERPRGTGATDHRPIVHGLRFRFDYQGQGQQRRL